MNLLRKNEYTSKLSYNIIQVSEVKTIRRFNIEAGAPVGRSAAPPPPPFHRPGRLHGGAVALTANQTPRLVGQG